MKTKQLVELGGLRTFAVVMDRGDDAAAELMRFATDHHVGAAGLTAVGACQAATIGYFDPVLKDYRNRTFNDQMEVLSLVGDIALREGTPSVHAHVVLGRPDFSTIGGHLQHLIVSPTLEVIVTETPGHLAKRIDQDTGLALIDLGR